MNEEQISKNIKSRYNIRFKKSKLLDVVLKIQNFTPYNYSGNINNFFIFLNLFKTDNIKKEINKIFTENTQIIVNNKSMKFFSFLKRILLLNLNKFNYNFDITKMKIQKNVIFIDNILNVYFNNCSRITKIEIFNDQAITNINISNFNFKDNSDDKFNIDFINYNFENDNNFKNSLFDGYHKNYISKNVYSMNKISLLVNFHNLYIFNKDINKYYKKYNNYYCKYIIFEKNLQLIMSLFMFYYHNDINDFLRLYSLLFAKEVIVKLNNKIYDIKDFIYRYTKLKEYIYGFNFDIKYINVQDKKNVSILINISGKYNKTYEFKNTKLFEAKNQNIYNNIKLDIKLNDKNRIIEFNLTSINEILNNELINKYYQPIIEDNNELSTEDNDTLFADELSVDELSTKENDELSIKDKSLNEKEKSVSDDDLEEIDEDDVFESIFFNTHN